MLNGRVQGTELLPILCNNEMHPFAYTGTYMQANKPRPLWPSQASSRRRRAACRVADDAALGFSR
eukprot:scaffold574904_cov15-Prasinocladus_malaysianus.AAC.1